MIRYESAVPAEILEVADLLETVALPDPLDETQHVFCRTRDEVLAYFIRSGIETVLELAIMEHDSSREAFRIWNQIGCFFDEHDVTYISAHHFIEGSAERELIEQENRQGETITPDFVRDRLGFFDSRLERLDRAINILGPMLQTFH